MFNKDFFPTPINVIDEMLQGISIQDKVILEPSAGKGNIVDYLQNKGAGEVIACELNDDLRLIVESKCRVLENNFLKVESHQISHINMIVMNPPFSADEKHILHAWNIAPAGCKIIALCNTATLENTYSSSRKELVGLIASFGVRNDIGDAFNESERETGVKVSIVTLQKAGDSSQSEFEGFFLEDDPEETQMNGIMSYNVVRDVVNRYVESIKLFDKQLELAVQMNYLTTGYFFTKEKELGMSISEKYIPKQRADFKKSMQKEGWSFIFKKLNMEKYATKGVKEDINKFVEQQNNIPFTMRNIYKMLEIVVGTQEQRMDKAMEEVFDKLTKYSDENRMELEGWKSNSAFLVTERFVMPYMVEPSYSRGFSVRSSGNIDIIEDLVKALCYITGKNYDHMICLRHRSDYSYRLKDAEGEYLLRDTRGYSAVYHTREKDQAEREVEHFYKLGKQVFVADDKPNWGEWFDWTFFEVKAFKKGTMHFKFKDQSVWNMFNQNIARIKGYPTVLSSTQTKYQNRNAGRKSAA